MKGVSRRFPKKRFVPIGDLPSDRLGLSRRRGQELALIQAWSRTAGPVLATKALPLGVRHGLLEVGLREDDESWRRTLLDVLPRLAAGIATVHPELRIERVQLVSPEGESIGPSALLDGRFLERGPSVGTRYGPGVATRVDRTRGEAVDDARLERLMHLYLERCSETDGSSGT